jgi:hypothetical protein
VATEFQIPSTLTVSIVDPSLQVLRTNSLDLVGFQASEFVCTTVSVPSKLFIVTELEMSSVVMSSLFDASLESFVTDSLNPAASSESNFIEVPMTTVSSHFRLSETHFFRKWSRFQVLLPFQRVPRIQ